MTFVASYNFVVELPELFETTAANRWSQNPILLKVMVTGVKGNKKSADDRVSVFCRGLTVSSDDQRVALDTDFTLAALS